MSLKLLKQSLDILDEPLSNDNNSKNIKDIATSTELKNPFAASQRKVTLTKDRRPSSKKKPTVYNEHTLTTRYKQKKNIEELRKEILPDKNKTNINLKRLLALSQNTINENDAEKIIKRNNKGKTIQKRKKAKEPKSIFTEEDFLAFEREYFATNS